MRDTRAKPVAIAKLEVLAVAYRTRVVASIAASCMMLIAGVALVGCGGGSGTTTSEQQALASATRPSPPAQASRTSHRPSVGTSGANGEASLTASPNSAKPLVVWSPALGGGVLATSRPIPRRYTCAGANVSLPLQWRSVPRGTRELGVFVLHHKKGGYIVDWGVVGLKPTLHGLSAGRLPQGAIVGRNSSGQTRYSVCPPKGQEIEYGVFVHAFSRPLYARPGFEPLALLGRTERASLSYGLTAFTSKR
jgi:phosphatidylethanolamine-binding protein (PEBP) family uncharacterized protein